MRKVGGSLVWSKREMMLVKLKQDPGLLKAVLREDSSKYCIASLEIWHKAEYQRGPGVFDSR